MQYMILIYEPESAYEGEAGAKPADRHRRQAHGAGRRPARQGRACRTARACRASTTATTVATQGGQQTVHDGPFAETREHLGGYYLIDVPDLDAALAIAKRVPVVDGGKVEVRPLMVALSPMPRWAEAISAARPAGGGRAGRAGCATSTWPRTPSPTPRPPPSPPGRSSRRATRPPGCGARRCGGPSTPGAAPPSAQRAVARRARARAHARGGADGRRRADPRRAAAADLRLLPPGHRAGRPRRPDAEGGLRALDRAAGPRLPGGRARHAAADHPGQAQDPRRRRALRGPRPRGLAGAAGGCAGHPRDRLRPGL